jgi:hypothetical protein
VFPPRIHSSLPRLGGESTTEAYLRRRLARNPGDALALLLLALEFERQGNRDKADSAMKTAARLAPADPQSLLLVAGYYLRTGEEVAALTTLRRAVDSAPGEVSARVWPVFTAALVSGRHQSYFDAMARENAKWWPDFFRHACAGAVPVSAVQAIFAVRVAAENATVDERQCLVERLQRDGQWTGAYVLWLDGLPPERRRRVGYVFNGDFEAPLSNTGFDWRIPAQESAVVSAEPGEGVNGKRGLSVSFTNYRYAGPPVYQKPAAGNRVGISSKAERGPASRPGWACSGACTAKTNPDVRPGSSSAPSLSSAPCAGANSGRTFVVPANCPAQLLRLELANPKQGASGPADVAIRLKGKVWFDDIRIRIVDEREGRR